MLDFLKECNVSISIIENIKKENSSANIYNLSCNQDETIKIINYLKELNITCIDDLLVYRIDLFFHSLDDIKKFFSKYDKKI